MSKASVKVLADALAGRVTEQGTFDSDLDSVLRAVGRVPVLTLTTGIEVTDPPYTAYRLPAGTVKVLDVFFDDVRLDFLSARQLEAVRGRDWQSHVGDPVAYTVEGVDSFVVRLYPKPEFKSVGAGSLFTGSPLGADYPIHVLFVMHTTTAIEPDGWLDLPLALMVLSKLYAHEAVDRDVTFAGACQALGQYAVTLTLGGHSGQDPLTW